MTHVDCESKLRSDGRSSMHLFLGHWVVIRRAVVYYHYARAPTHIVQELNVSTVLYVCDVSMLNVYGYDLYILERNGVLLKI